jgi:hypothetical protein
MFIAEPPRSKRKSPLLTDKEIEELTRRHHQEEIEGQRDYMNRIVEIVCPTSLVDFTRVP